MKVRVILPGRFHGRLGETALCGHTYTQVKLYSEGEGNLKWAILLRADEFEPWTSR